MAKLVIHQDKIPDLDAFMGLCPFKAIQNTEGKLEINAACKMCKICVKKGPAGAAEYIEEELTQIDKSLWKGIAVYVEHVDGDIHPVTLELVGKAKELALKVNQPVYALFIGHAVSEKARELLHYGIDRVFVYDTEELKDFRIECYTAAAEDFINNLKPSVILVGATSIGRSLAPRIAARFRTGLTADCTVLDIKENTDLIQIRPAFGGNIMAQIATPNNRPQIATVRYKVMSAPERCEAESGSITQCSIPKEMLKSGIQVVKTTKKEKEVSISDAEIIVVAGRGLKSEKDMQMVRELAEILGAQVAATRSLVESGWVDAKKQIGLSGRTVKPKLIITCGVSGAVQFAAGMKGSDCIIAINSDEKAPIFQIAHYGIVGDIYEVIPGLVKNIRGGQEVEQCLIKA